MISPVIEKILLDTEGDLIIEGHRVATVRAENTCLHAMMVLNSVGYSSIPVLDREGRVAGEISMPLILSTIKDELEYNWDQLSDHRVSEGMSNNIPVLDQYSDLEDVLHHLVNHSFICLVDDEGYFRGIITRRELLKRVNYLAHEFDRLAVELEL